MNDPARPRAPARGVNTSETGQKQYPEDRVAHAIAHSLGPGDTAALRRADPHDPSTPAFWRVFAQHVVTDNLPDGGRWRDGFGQRWGAAMQCMAILGDLHRPGARLGRALAASTFSELRLARLLRAHGDTLHDAVRLAARYLNAQGEPADAADLARLILSDGGSHAEPVRRRIARDYFANLQEG